MLRYKIARILFFVVLVVVALRDLADLLRLAHIVPRTDPAAALWFGPMPVLTTGPLTIAVAAWIVVAIFFWGLYPIIRNGRLPTIDESVLLPAPPPDLTPAMTVVLRTGRADKEAFVAAIADLIHRGLIEVRRDLSVVVPATSTTTSPSAAGFGEAETELLRRFESVAGDEGVLTYERARSGIGAGICSYFSNILDQTVAASPWMNQDPSPRMRLWPRIGGAMAAVGFCLYGLVAWSGGDPNPALLWAFPWVGLAGLLIALGSYEVYFHRTKTGAYHYAMAIAYRNTLKHALEDSQSEENRVSMVRERMEWCKTPDEMVVWALALGLGDESQVDPSDVPDRWADGVLSFESMDWLQSFGYAFAAKPEKEAAAPA
jgi:hypothetical protein